MATIKSYTDISQSKALAEILPLESADMHYSKDFDGRWVIDLAKYISVKIPKYVGNVEEHLLPCWSLAALLGTFNEIKMCHYNNRYYCQYMSEGSEFPIYSTVEYNNPIDACYEMILKLNVLNLL